MSDRQDHPAEINRVTMAHGAGGRLSRQLVREVILKYFGHPALLRLEDSAVFDVAGGRLAFTTDSYVIHPLFFPGGDIGKLAVAGTVNDLLCAGARPLYLSLALIVEEGLPLADLEKALASASREARRAGVEIICGDTKVVEHGKGDGLFVNTSGVGLVPDEVEVSPQRIQTGDAIIVSGTLGDHGIAILSQREGFGFASKLKSDCASLVSLIQGVMDPGLGVRCLRDPTRGGLGTVRAEIAQDRQLGFEIDEVEIPIRDEVRGAGELLGIDYLYVANEGRFIAIVPEAAADRALEILKEANADATNIGVVSAAERGIVTLKSQIGATRILDLLSGEQLPRIC